MVGHRKRVGAALGFRTANNCLLFVRTTNKRLKAKNSGKLRAWQKRQDRKETGHD